MGDLSQNMQAKSGLANRFGLVQDYNQPSGYAPSDRTSTAIRNLGNENKIDQKNVIDQLTGLGYGDLGQDVQNTLNNRRLRAGATNGYRNTGLGTVLGTGAGHFLGNTLGLPGGEYVGAALGASAGATIDKYGGPIAKTALDGALLVKRLASRPETAKFAGAIENAAAKGQQSLATTHFILSQTEPAYQAAMKEDGNKNSSY